MASIEMIYGFQTNIYIKPGLGPSQAGAKPWLTALAKLEV
jgi:hypothetical protein